jgi:hypothetical protein
VLVDLQLRELWLYWSVVASFFEEAERHVDDIGGRWRSVSELEAILYDVSCL